MHDSGFQMQLNRVKQTSPVVATKFTASLLKILQIKLLGPTLVEGLSSKEKSRGGLCSLLRIATIPFFTFHLTIAIIRPRHSSSSNVAWKKARHPHRGAFFCEQFISSIKFDLLGSKALTFCLYLP